MSKNNPTERQKQIKAYADSGYYEPLVGELVQHSKIVLGELLNRGWELDRETLLSKLAEIKRNDNIIVTILHAQSHIEDVVSNDLIDKE